MSNLSRDIPSEAESEPETETVEDKKPKGKPVIARTILSPDDLELEIEGLPEETPVNTDDTFIDISKILSEIPETTETSIQKWRTCNLRTFLRLHRPNSRQLYHRQPPALHPLRIIQLRKEL
ncbi:MAG: hypothetical protein ACLUI7_05885 [Coprococcus sp.]